MADIPVSTTPQLVEAIRNGPLPGYISQGALEDFDEEVVVAKPEDWDGNIDGSTVVQVINGVAVPLDFALNDPVLSVYPLANIGNFDGKEVSCKYCHEYPCVMWSEEAKAIIQGQVDRLDGTGKGYFDLPPQEKKTYRFECYRAFNRLLEGIGQKGVRVKLPECVTNDIKEAFPDTAYTGFKESK